MGNNRYISDLDKKINYLITQYETGAITKKVLGIAMGMVIRNYYGSKLSELILDEPAKHSVLGLSVKKVTEYYRATI